jgi:hypothetical protein
VKTIGGILFDMDINNVNYGVLSTVCSIVIVVVLIVLAIWIITSSDISFKKGFFLGFKAAEKKSKTKKEDIRISQPVLVSYTDNFDDNFAEDEIEGDIDIPLNEIVIKVNKDGEICAKKKVSRNIKRIQFNKS